MMHPCLTPDVVWNRLDNLDPIRTRSPSTADRYIHKI